MREVFVGKKKVRAFHIQLIWMRDLQKIAAPKKEYKSLWEEYWRAAHFLPQLRDYFPDFDEEGKEEYTPQRVYFWNVYHSLDPESVTKYVERLMRWGGQKK